MPPKKDGKDKKQEKAPPDAKTKKLEEAFVESTLALENLKRRFGREEQLNRHLEIDSERMNKELKADRLEARRQVGLLLSKLLEADEQEQSLTQQLHELRETIEEKRAFYDSELRQLMAELAISVGDLEQDVNAAHSKLMEAAAYSDGKAAEEEARLRELGDLLEVDKKRHEAEMADREVRLREDRAQLLREMERLLSHTKESVSAMADGLIKPAVKRIIARNEQMSAELGFQVSQTRLLGDHNERLAARIKELKKQLDRELMEEKRLALKNNMLKREAAAFNQVVEAAAEVQAARLEELAEAQAETTRNARALAALREELEETQAGLDRLEAEANMRRNVAAEGRRELIAFLEQCVEDVECLIAEAELEQDEEAEAKKQRAKDARKKQMEATQAAFDRIAPTLFRGSDTATAAAVAAAALTSQYGRPGSQGAGGGAGPGSRGSVRDHGPVHDPDTLPPWEQEREKAAAMRRPGGQGSVSPPRTVSASTGGDAAAVAPMPPGTADSQRSAGGAAAGRWPPQVPGSAPSGPSGRPGLNSGGGAPASRGASRGGRPGTSSDGQVKPWGSSASATPAGGWPPGSSSRPATAQFMSKVERLQLQKQRIETLLRFMVESDRIAREATAEAAAATAQLDPGDVFAEAERSGAVGGGGAGDEEGDSAGNGDSSGAGDRGPQVMYDEGVDSQTGDGGYATYDVYDEGAGDYGSREPATLQEEQTAFMGSAQDDEYAD